MSYRAECAWCGAYVTGIEWLWLFRLLARLFYVGNCVRGSDCKLIYTKERP